MLVARTTTMNNTLLSRLLPSRLCSSCRSTINASYNRGLSTTSIRNAASDRPASGLSSLASGLSRQRGPTTSSSNPLVERDIATLFGTDYYGRSEGEPHETEAARNLKQTYYMHVYATKHNTHITVCTPNHEPMKKLSLSAGNIGFKKSNRGTYDAAHQLTSYVLTQIVELGNLAQMKRIEIVLRGFGVGREAFTKAMLGQEGNRFRSRIVAVTDATRLKFGGTRSPKPRRLG